MPVFTIVTAVRGAGMHFVLSLCWGMYADVLFLLQEQDMTREPQLLQVVY